MIRFSVYSGLFLFALGCLSCTQKNQQLNVVTPVVYPDFTVLKPGNYWVYQNYELDSVNGAAHPLGTFDSAFVEKDTLINGNNYHKYMDLEFSSNNYNVFFLRDSLSYTVNSLGIILFSSSDFTSIFRTFSYINPAAGVIDTEIITERMGFKDSMVTVDAGTFQTYTFRQIYTIPPPMPFGPTREYDHAYSQGIGLIKETTGMYESIPNVYERRLVRYHLQ